MEHYGVDYNIDYGRMKIKVEELRLAKNISKNRICYRANVQRAQLNRYCTGEVTRMDTDVLVRLCYALDCTISDILEYVPPEEKPSEEESSD